MAQPNAYLKTVDRALQVLQFDQEHPEWSSSELARSLGLHRSIVYRILTTLGRRAFVTQVGQQGLWNSEEEQKALPKIVHLGREMVHEDGVAALLVSCVAAPGVPEPR
jgi:DNA-binding IclR family transcriptional regulator